MASLQERERIISEIHDINLNILNYDLENDLIKRERLGADLHFEVIKEQFIQIINIVSKVQQCDLQQVPFSALSNYKDAIGNIENNFQSIKAFKVGLNNPIPKRDSFITQIYNQIDNLIETATPILLVDLLRGTDFSLEKQQIETVLSEINNEKENTIKELVETKIDLKETLESAKRAAAQVGVAQHSIVFLEAAGFHSAESKKWRNSTIGILIGTGIAGLLFLVWMPTTDQGTPYLIQFTITKLVVLAVLFYSLSICIKNYRAHKHNEILNKHRQNALRTFETFVKSSTDEQTKNAVLLQTTMSIFSNQQTGYSYSENDADMPSKVIEIIKSAPIAKA